MTFLKIFFLDLKHFGVGGLVIQDEVKGELTNACILDGIFRVESLKKLKVALTPAVSQKIVFYADWKSNSGQR